MFKKISSAIMTFAILAVPAFASAHVVVKPATANVGDFVTFTVSVPNEKEMDVTNIKLDIPEGLAEVSPTVKNGWTVTTTTNGDAKDPAVTSINWASGSIPAGFRDDFTFSAQVPAKASDLDWKAFQTYADGTVVHWDQKPSGSDDSDGNAGPYSITKVTNDLAATPASTKSTNNGAALAVGLVALVLSIAGLLFRKKA